MINSSKDLPTTKEYSTPSTFVHNPVVSSVSGETRFIPQKNVDDYVKEASSKVINKESASLINETFGEEIEYWSNGNIGVKKILYELYSQSVDYNINIGQSFSYIDSDNTKHDLYEEGHGILNRKAMITELKKRAGFKFDIENQQYEIDKNFKILSLDLKDFRKADLQGAGDYDLNVFTRRLNLAIERIITELKVDKKDIVIGRYGGDEFTIAIIENKNPGHINPVDKKTAAKIKKYITDITQSEDGFFGENKPEKFIIKNVEKLDFISLESMNPVAQMIYLNAINIDPIFDLEMLNNEVGFIEESLPEMKSNSLNTTEDRRALIDFLISKNKSPYPDSISKLKDSKEIVHEKIKYLIRGHSELSLPYIMAEDSDAKDGGHRTEQLLDFYQNYLIDPLLHEIAMTRADIFDHIKRGEFTRIHAYEIKLKEINDNLSYVYGDKTIEEFWDKRFNNDKIHKLVEEGKIKIGRIGGIITICETGVELSAEERKFIDDPETTQSEYQGQILNHVVGHAVVETPKDVGQNPDEYKKVIDNIFNKPTEDWFRKTFRRIINSQTEFEEFINILTIDKYVSKNKNTMLSAKYFNSPTRANNRITTAFEVLDELRHQSLDFNLQVRVEQILIKIMELNSGYTGEKNFTFFNKMSFKNKRL